MRWKKLLWVACLAAAFLLIRVGFELFDGRSPQAVFVHEFIGFRALSRETLAGSSGTFPPKIGADTSETDYDYIWNEENS